LSFLLRRIAAGVATLLVATIVIFIAVSVLPGDAASNALGRQATPERLAAVRAQLGLDQPLVSQYLHWLGNALRGDLGNSAVAIAQGSPRAPVTDLIAGPLYNSVTLALIAAAFMVPLSLFFGVLAGVGAGSRRDHAISMTALALVALPEFVLGTLLILLFFSQLHLLPSNSIVPAGVSPLADPKQLVLPVLTLLGTTVASGIRLMRSGMVEVLEQEYVASARLNGIPERRVIWRHAFRNALAPTVQIIAQNLQYLFGGIIVVESLFTYQGLGRQLVQAILARDAPQIQAIALILATAYIAINIIADLLVVFLVPKLRTA
jgi:peptide/nickel transport system permease protein